MKKAVTKPAKSNQALLRKQILQSALASFKIEGIVIPVELAQATLKKIEAKLEKQP